MDLNNMQTDLFDKLESVLINLNRLYISYQVGNDKSI